MEDERTEIESLCMHCGKNGLTRFLPLAIPHFKQVVVSSFECEHCGNKNNEVLSARAIDDYGMEWTLNVASYKELSRQVVRSEHAVIAIPELQLEMPATPTTRGMLTTVEGLLHRIIDDLDVAKDQENLDHASVLQDIIASLQAMKGGTKSFTLILNDPAGNSYIESVSSKDIPMVPSSVNTSLALDDFLTVKKYTRSKEQNATLNFISSVHDQEPNNHDDEHEKDIVESVYEFQGSCPACGSSCPTKMHPIDIPHFKEVIIMATTCASCDFRSTEVKTGGPISSHGRRIVFSLQTIEDLSRDILKSETCSFSIPELDLELGPGTLGGRFTTVEGLLVQIRDEMEERVPFALGDSATQEQMERFQTLRSALAEIIAGEKNVTVIIDDPLSNSYLQSFFAPEPDPQISITDYERTPEQQDALGLSHLDA